MAKLSEFGFRFRALDVPEEFFDERQDDLKKAATFTMRDAAALAKRRLRTQVRMKFKNHGGASKFENSFNAWAYPDRKKTPKNSLSPKATIQANASWADIFEEGGDISPKRGLFMAIPTKIAEDAGLATANFGRGWRRRDSQTGARTRAKFGKTFSVKTRNGLFVAASRGGRTLFLFSLVKRVHENRRLSLRDYALQAFNKMPGLFEQAIERSQKR
jgi:hypothetical protein